MKIMLSSFSVVFEPELTEEQHAEAVKLSIPIDKAKRFSIWSHASYLRNWVDYPFPFLFADSLVVDDLALEGSMWTAKEAVDAGTVEFMSSVDPENYLGKWKEMESEHLRALCLRRLCDEKRKDQVFETYSAQSMIEDKKEKFQEELFNIALDQRFSRFAQRKTSEMIEKGVFRYGEMVVSPWLYETFRTSIAIFAQKEILPDEPLPVYDKEPFRGFYQNALLAEGRVKYSSDSTEASWIDFLEILPQVAEKLPAFPLSKNYITPEDLTNRIMELRSDREITQMREKLYRVFLDLKHATPLGQVGEKLLERFKEAQGQKRRIKFRMLLKSLLGSMVFGGHLATIQIALGLHKPVDLRISLLALPYFVYKLAESLERDYEKCETYCWTGFFEKIN